MRGPILRELDEPLPLQCMMVEIVGRPGTTRMRLGDRACEWGSWGVVVEVGRGSAAVAPSKTGWAMRAWL